MKAARDFIVGAWWTFVSSLALVSLGVVMIATGSTPEHATSTLIGTVAVVIGMIALGIAIEQGRAAKRSDEQRERIICRMDEIAGLLRDIHDRGQPEQSP